MYKNTYLHQYIEPQGRTHLPVRVVFEARVEEVEAQIRITHTSYFPINYTQHIITRTFTHLLVHVFFEERVEEAETEVRCHDAITLLCRRQDCL